jgi:hypothetical protein
MNAIVRPSRSAWLTFDEIDLPDGRPYNAAEVVALANSIRQIGLLTPLTVIERSGRYLLVTGRHRLEALRLVKADRVPVRIVDFDDIDARLWTISDKREPAPRRAYYQPARRSDRRVGQADRGEGSFGASCAKTPRRQTREWNPRGSA